MAPAASPSDRDGERVGPHPSYIEVAKPYILQSRIQKCLTDISMTDAKEDAVRLQGVAWIDQVRRALQLPIRTFNTAVIYYHKFRLLHAENEYNWADASAAALFTACKIEDTLKKSREILCAHWNLKVGPGESLSSDDPRFESHSKLIIGLERLMLESAGFDFRNRYPQKVMLKLARALKYDANTEAKTAWNVSIDLYRTFAPLKQSTPTVAIACLELAARLHGKDTAKLVDAGPIRYSKWATSRAEIMETLQDLIDLYTHHRGATSVGPLYTLEHFIEIRIGLNQEATAANIPRFSLYESDAGSTANGAKTKNGIHLASPATPATPGTISPGTDQPPKSAIGIRGQNGTVRFMLDAARAHDERAEVDKFYKVEEEEYEEEVPNDTRVDDRERERARAGRDFTSFQDSLSDGRVADSDDQNKSTGTGDAGGYWDRYRQRLERASRNQSPVEPDNFIHPSRRAAYFDTVDDMISVQGRQNYDGRGYRGRGSWEGRARGYRDRRNTCGDGDGFNRESGHNYSGRRSSVSSYGDAEYERTFDLAERNTTQDWGWDDNVLTRGGTASGRGDYYRGSSYDNFERDGSIDSVDSRYRPRSSRAESIIKDQVSPRRSTTRDYSQSREALVRPDRMPLVLSAPEAPHIHPDRMPLVSSASEPTRLDPNGLPLVSHVPEPDRGSRPQVRTNEGKQQEPANKVKGLSAADGHQWAKSDSDNDKKKGKGKQQRPRGRGYTKQ